MYEELYGISPFLQNVSFCDSTNQDTCIMYLSKELVALGLSPLYNNGSNQCDKVKLINAIYNLLGHYTKERRCLEELQNRILRLTSDLETQRCHRSRLQERLEQSEKNGQNHQEKHRQLALKNKTLQAELKTEREECRRLQSVLQQRDAQYQHEQRRRERELTQLKQTMTVFMSNKKPRQVPELTLKSGLARADGRRGKWTTEAVSSRNEDDFQKRIVSCYEHRSKALLDENSSLREIISGLHSELTAAMQECKDESSGDDCSSSSPLSQILQQTGAGLTSDKMQSVVFDTWHRLKGKWDESTKENKCKCDGHNSSDEKTSVEVN